MELKTEFKHRTGYLPQGVLMREDEGKEPVIAGVAIVTDAETTLYECNDWREIEVIDQSCIAEDFIKEQDIKLNLLHERNSSFARSCKGKGGLLLESREDGLHFETAIPDCDLGKRAKALIENGTYNGCSFEFWAKDYEVSERKGADGKLEYVIRHTAFEKIGAITIGMDPAYKQTSVGLRELVEQPAEEVPEVAEPAEEVYEERENINNTSIEEDMENNNNNAQELQELREQIGEIAMKVNESREKAPVKAKSLVACIRENKGNEFGMQLRSGEFTTTSGAAAIDKDIKPIVDPVYANSVFGKIGARMYTNLPQGTQVVPVLGKGNFGWKGEVAAAGAAGTTLTGVELTPKRLTAYIDLSNTMLAEDSHETNAAIQRDLINGIWEALEATVFGDAAGDTTKPAGIFNGQTLSDATTYAKLVDVEADVETANYTNIKYVLSPKAKADIRNMKYSGNNANIVWGGNAVDGTPAEVTSNVKAGTYVVGDFSNLAIGLWGSATVLVDDKSQAINDVTRLVVHLYADAKVIRSAAFAFGRTRTIS